MKHIPTKSSLLAFDHIFEKANILKGHTAADLGCGNSLFFLYGLSDLVGDTGKIFAVDLIPSIIDQLQREIKHHNLSSINPVHGNLDILNGVKIEDQSVDRSFLINTLHQSSDTLTMLSEAIRLTKQGGKIVVIDWLKNSIHPLGPSPERRLSKEIVLDTANLLQLELSDEFKPGPFHFGFIFTNN